MDESSSAWLDDPGRDPAAVMDIKAVCPSCGEPVQNPTPVLVRLPYVSEAWCICPAGHTWITRWATTDDESETAAQCG